MTKSTTSAAELEPRLCPYAQTSHAYHITDRSPRMIAIGCRRWTCDVCGPRRKAHLIREIVLAHPNRFLTLTCRHEQEPSEQLRRITKALPRLITALRKRHGGIEYLRMLETCADGYPHFHLLMRSAFIPHANIKELWTKNTGATIVDIRKAHGRSTGYVAKYIQKARSIDQTWSRQRISVSKHFWIPDAKYQELIGWQTERKHPQQTCEEHPATYYAREWIGRYIPGPRQPGDELPEELRGARPLSPDDYVAVTAAM